MDSKSCSKCKVVKPITEFFHRENNRLTSQCKACISERQAKARQGNPGLVAYHTQKSKEWFERQTQEVKDERSRYASKRRKEVKDVWVKKFGGKCLHCEGIFPNCVFEFHHLNDAEKEYSPSHLFHLKPETIERELAKCVMLCANCHRIEHERLKYAVHAKRYTKEPSISEK